MLQMHISYDIRFIINKIKIYVSFIVFLQIQILN